LKRAAVVALVLLVIAPAARAAEPDPEPVSSAQAHQKKMQGTWDIVRAEEDGRDMRKEVIGATIRIDKDRIIITSPARKGDEPATFKLDARKKPPQIDITPDKGGRGEMVRGIYRVGRDELVLVFTEGKKDRPTNFDGKGAIKVVLKRQKAK
jgi:uncharacterized protein (TIGR03067 family)